MAKAVLIMDMPERCDKCLLLLKIPQKDGLALCLARPKNGQEKYNPKHEKSWRPDWCPLREMPEKKDAIIYENDNWITVDEKKKNEGWNACLDEILKEPQNKGGASKTNPTG